MQHQQEYITLLKMDSSKDLRIQLAILFGLGKIVGGGTWASLLVLLIALYEKNVVTVTFLTFITLIIGQGSYNKLSYESNSEDPKEYVLDEVIGMGIALNGVFNIVVRFDFYNNLINNIDMIFILTFIIFRFFDISKIGPVGWIENNQNVRPYYKVVGDDIVASFLSIVVVIIILSINLWVL